jgi:hypothetical protein
MPSQADLGPTDVVRANVEVLAQAASLFARASSLVALVMVAVLATLATRGEEAGASVHVSTSLVANCARGLGAHFVLISALLLVMLTLGSVFGSRRILAPQRPGSLVRLFDEARRSILKSRAAGDLAALLPLSVHRRLANEAEPNDVLAQLRQSLILSPSAPPGQRSVDPQRSMHRVVSNHFSEVVLTR